MERPDFRNSVGCAGILWESGGKSCETYLPGGAFTVNSECATRCLSGKSIRVLVQGKQKEDEGCCKENMWVQR